MKLCPSSSAIGARLYFVFNMLSLGKLVGNGFVCMKVWKVTLIDRNTLGTQVFWALWMNYNKQI